MENFGGSRFTVETISLTANPQFQGFTVGDIITLENGPSEKRWLSEEFGNTEAGFWKVEVIYCLAIGSVQSVALNLRYSSDYTSYNDERAAGFSAVVLNKDGRAMKKTRKAFDMCVFDARCSFNGWDPFLGPMDRRWMEKNYFVHNDCLRLKIIVNVYRGFLYFDQPPGILQIVQRRCQDDKDDDNSDDDSALHADDNDNQSTVGVNSVSSDKQPPTDSTADASASSSLSPWAGVETTNSENCPRCIVPRHSMLMDLSNFAVNPRTYDITVVCQGRKFRCHRFILGARSEVFKAMLYGEFAESKKSEIEINDIPSDCVEEFLTFLATDTCSSLKLPLRCQCGDATVCSGNEVCRYVRGKDALYHTPRLLNLLVAADKYQVPELSSKCIEALAKCIYYRTVSDVLDTAETLQCRSLIDACWHYINNCEIAQRNVKKLRRRLQASSS